MKKIDLIESIVIVRSGPGYTATLRFSNHKLDRMFSRNSHDGIYESIERYIEESE